MITVKIYKNNSGDITGMFVSGHSNTAPRGYDIYCAGVSVLSQSVLIVLTDYLGMNCVVESDSGLLKCFLKDEPTDLTNVVFQVAIKGMEKISELTDVVKIIYLSDSDVND